MRGLQVAIAGSRILRGVDLTVPAGQVLCLLGRNGVGKTTTLKALMGLLAPAAGRIRFFGREVTGMAAADRARLGFGYVPQGREIFPQLTVEENLLVGLRARRGGGRRETRARLEWAGELFPALRDLFARRGGMLSGGQQQQLAIARALLPAPRLLMLDEPTEGIQPSVIDQIGDVIRRLRAEGRLSILLVEQYLEFGRELADTFALMDRGAVVVGGPIRDLTDDLVRAHLTV